MLPWNARPRSRGSVGTVGIVLLALFGVSEGEAASSPGEGGLGLCSSPPTVAPGASDYYTIPLVRTGRAPGAGGVAEVRFVDSPFGVAVTGEGHYVYEIHLRASGLRRVPGRTYAAWLTTPDLDEVTRLGPLDENLEVRGLVTWNKYLVVVTAETEEPGETWAGAIVLRGLSLSGMLESMAGHGPLDSEECYYLGFQSQMPI